MKYLILTISTIVITFISSYYEIETNTSNAFSTTLKKFADYSTSTECPVAFVVVNPVDCVNCHKKTSSLFETISKNLNKEQLVIITPNIKQSNKKILFNDIVPMDLADYDVVSNSDLAKEVMGVKNLNFTSSILVYDFDKQTTVSEESTRKLTTNKLSEKVFKWFEGC